jgi:hypothetical protein
MKVYMAAERSPGIHVLGYRSRGLDEECSMRASHIAIIGALLAIPTVSYSQQDSGPVGGRVGADLGASPAQPAPSAGSRPYAPPVTAGPRAGYAGSIAAGQVVPQNVPITPRPGGMGSAFIDGHRVLVDPNTNRILRVFN